MGDLKPIGPGPERGWCVPPDLEQLKASATAWLQGATKDRVSNRQFLDSFAVYLVKYFRAKEAHLQQTGDPGLSRYRQKHRRLVQRAWRLMGDDHLGLEVTDGIHRLLEAWDLHQAFCSQRFDLPRALDN